MDIICLFPCIVYHVLSVESILLFYGIFILSKKLSSCSLWSIHLLHLSPRDNELHNAFFPELQQRFFKDLMHFFEIIDSYKVTRDL